MWADEKKEDLSVEQVLSFVRTAYQVNEAVEGAPVKVDWNALSANPLLSKLKEREFLDCDESSIEEDSKLRRSNSLDVSRRRKSSNEIPIRQSSLDKHSDRSRLPNKSTQIDMRRAIGRRRSSLTAKKDALTALEASPVNKTAERYIKRKLNQVLQEGILDSVLPYILSKQSQSLKKNLPPPISIPPEPVFPESKKISSSSSEKSDNNIGVFGKRDTRRKSTSSVEGKLVDKKDVEVVIHVCDEVKNMKKDFKCGQSILVSRMRYFAQVTAGQRLDEMDISVHCDVNIFDWLIRWVKQEGNPVLDTSIVVPVLMSSAFLQMDTLQETCLEYCKTHINEVIRDSSNLGCINDSVLTRLANMFSNSEIEALKDRKDKLVSKLYCKLIMFLSESVPQLRRGHYSSIAYLFSCEHHSEQAQFFSMEHQRSMSFPVGRYPCCGEKAFRFEALASQTGCQKREHVPVLQNETDSAIMKIFKAHRELIRVDHEEPEVVKVPVGKETLWWEGIELVPPKTRQSLLGNCLDAVIKPSEKRGSSESKTCKLALPATVESSESSCSESSDGESCGSGEDSGESYHAAVRVTAKPRSALTSLHASNPPKKEASQVWLAKLSTRCNQDNQREFEERAIRHMLKVLTKKTGGDTLSSAHRTHENHQPPGGIYVRLESEWREAHCSSHGCPASTKLRMSSNSKLKTRR